MHPEAGLARIDEASDELEIDALNLDEPVDRGAGRVGHRPDHGRIILAMSLRGEVGREELRAIFDALLPLQACPGRWDKARRERRRSGRSRVTLQDDDLNALLAQGKGCHQTTGAGADHHGWKAELESRL